MPFRLWRVCTGNAGVGASPNSLQQAPEVRHVNQRFGSASGQPHCADTDQCADPRVRLARRADAAHRYSAQRAGAGANVAARECDKLRPQAAAAAVKLRPQSAKHRPQAAATTVKLRPHAAAAVKLRPQAAATDKLRP